MAREAVYGRPPAALATAGADSTQISPLIPGADAIEGLAEASLDRIVVAAPPGTLERRYVMAHALRALGPEGRMLVVAPKDRGGSRLRRELETFACAVNETARRHHRICAAVRPANPVGLEAAIEDGGPRIVAGLGLWSQPGVFSWDRLDPGSALLIESLTALVGRGADLGCGIGVLGRAILASPAVTALSLIDIDRRAVDACRRNFDDPRAEIVQADLRERPANLADLDFVVMNPPFHDGGTTARGLGHAMAATAARMLRRGGIMHMVANVALPYEPTLARDFTKVTLLGRADGYKVLQGIR